MENVTYENGVMRVVTPRGVIVVSANPTDYPGISIDLENPNAIGCKKGEASLAMIEFNPTKDVMQAVVWGNGFEEDATDIIEYRNILKDYEMKFNFLRHDGSYDVYNVSISNDEYSMSFEFDVSDACDGIDEEMVLEFIGSNYKLFLKLSTLDKYRKYRGDVENIEDDYNGFKNLISEYTDVFGIEYLHYLAKIC